MHTPSGDLFAVSAYVSNVRPEKWVDLIIGETMSNTFVQPKYTHPLATTGAALHIHNTSFRGGWVYARAAPLSPEGVCIDGGRGPQSLIWTFGGVVDDPLKVRRSTVSANADPTYVGVIAQLTCGH